MSDDRWVHEIEPGGGDAAELIAVAERALASGDRELAATAYDRAYAHDPGSAEVAAARAAVLDSLAVTENGMAFRYVPAGCYLIGSPDGDPDERPAHYVRLDAFWVSQTPVSWAGYCALMDWEAPPHGLPRDFSADDQSRFNLVEASKIRLQYCEDFTTRALDWHAHAGMDAKFFGQVPRSDPAAPAGYGEKPMVAVSWQEADELGARLTWRAERDNHGTAYRLPTEAQWEAAARGGLARKRYPWGDDRPDPTRCDFWHLDEPFIRRSRDLPPNGYGLFGMSGGVWEWTADWYDARYYAESPRFNPAGPESGKQRVLRGGSWTDFAEAVTVSFRFARESAGWWEGQNRAHWKINAPNIGFRLCRTARPLSSREAGR